MLARDLRSVEEAASSPLDRARLLAATVAHGSEWIFALLITVSATKLAGSPSDCDLDFPCANLTLVHAAVSSAQEGYTDCPANGVLVGPHATSS